MMAQTKTSSRGQLLLVALLGLAVFLFGCSPVQLSDRSKFVERHTQQFNQKITYTEHTIKRPDGFGIYVREFGRASSKSGPTIILMHGFPDNLRAYDLIIPHLTKNHHVVAFDFLGWGQSDKPAAHVYDVASMSVDLQAVIEQLGGPKVTLVAHDLSGLPGIDWALNQPEQMDKLILLNTVYGPSNALVSPDYIQKFASSGEEQNAIATQAKTNRHFWREVYMKQMTKFFTDPTIKDTYAELFLEQSYDARKALSKRGCCFACRSQSACQKDRRHAQLFRIRASYFWARRPNFECRCSSGVP